MLLPKSPVYPRQSQAQAATSSPSQVESSSSSAPLSSSLTIPSSSATTLAPSSPSSDSRTLTSSTSASTSNAISSSTSISSPTSTGVTLSSTAISSSTIPTVLASSSSRTSTTTEALSSSSPPADLPLLSLTPSSGFFFSTLTTSFVTDIGGNPTTIVTPVVTALRTSTPSRASARTNLIAGSAIGGLVLFIIGLTTLFVLRRRVQRRQYWALTRKQLPSRATFLAGEDMDFPHPSPPFVYSGQDPFASPRTSSYIHSQSSRTQSPSLSSLPPRLFRPRASESGSIFQESVWPPPSASSQLMDPLTSPSQSVDLTRIIDDVMGPLRAGSPAGARNVSEIDPLLTVHTHGQGQQQEQGHMREHKLEGSAVVAPPLTFTLANPDNNRPETPEFSPPSPPPSRWLSRSPNRSPKNSPLHKAQAI